MLWIKHFTLPVYVCFVFVIVSFTHFSYAEDISYTQYDIILNGDFEKKRSLWHRYASDILHVSDENDNVNGIMRLLSINKPSDYRYAFKKLIIPTELVSATIRLDYRVIEHENHNDAPIIFEISIGTSTGFDSENLEKKPLSTIGVIHSETIDAPFDWKELNLSLSEPLIGEIKAARDAGEFIFLKISQTNTLRGEGTHRFKTDLEGAIQYFRSISQ